jgi:hypothetical protein
MAMQKKLLQPLQLAVSTAKNQVNINISIGRFLREKMCFKFNCKYLFMHNIRKIKMKTFGAEF